MKMLAFLFCVFLGINGSLARDICTRSSVLQEWGSVKMAVPKKIPMTGDLSVQKELVDNFDKNLDQMMDVKKSNLDKRPYKKQTIFNNYMFKIITSNLSYAREGCTNLGQGYDILMARETELDLDMIDFAGKQLKDLGSEELPLGVIKTKRGIETLTGGWFDGYTNENQQKSDDMDIYKTSLMVVCPSNYSFYGPQADDKEFKIFCTRKAHFPELSKANHNFMSNALGKLQKVLQFGKGTMDLREKTYEDKPEGQPRGRTLELQPTQRFIDLTHGLNRMSSETGWWSDSIDTNFLTNMYQKAKDVFGQSLKNVFRTQLTHNQRDNIKSAYNLMGRISDGISTFTGTRSTAKENVYTGELEFIMTSRAENYKLYKINALGLDNGQGVISQKYLVQRNGTSFTTDDLKWLGNCQVTKGDEGPICNSLNFTPSLESRRCASQILLNQELDSCDLELFSKPKGIRTNCNEEANAIVSTQEKITATLVCNGQQNGYFEIPAGTHKLSTGCGLKVENFELLAEDISDRNQTPPFLIKEESFLDLVDEEDYDDMMLLALASLGGLLVILILTIICIVCCKCKSKRRYEPVENGKVLKNLRRQQKLIADMVAISEK